MLTKDRIESLARNAEAFANEAFSIVDPAWVRQIPKEVWDHSIAPLAPWDTFTTPKDKAECISELAKLVVVDQPAWAASVPSAIVDELLIPSLPEGF